MLKKTLVIGASLNPERYSNIVINRLVNSNIEVVAIGLREGIVAGIDIVKSNELTSNLLKFKKIHTVTLYLHTVTLYLNAKRQQDYYDYIISLKPKRVIFNPGTENETFYELLKSNNIDFEIACTLVLLQMKIY